MFFKRFEKDILNVQRVKDMINGTELVVQSNTNLNPKNLISYLEACVKYGYEVICILPINDLLHFQSEHLKTRSRQIQHLVETRSRGIRIIPEDVIYRMVNDFDSIKFFYQKLVNERCPRKWIESINNPFFETTNYPVSIVDITNETIDKIKTDDDVTFYTPVMESLELITDSEDTNPYKSISKRHILLSWLPNLVMSGVMVGVLASGVLYV